MAGDGWDGPSVTRQATRPEIFALKNSGLHAFLYADVGTERNGSPLTILSVLARLGSDPWAQAASWAAMPRAAAVDGLAQSIAQMPLLPAALAGSREIATRLVQFLPATARQVIPAEADGAAPGRLDAQPVMMIWLGIAAWIGLTLMLSLMPATDVRPAGPPAVVAGSIATGAAPPANHGTPGIVVRPQTGTARAPT